MKRKNNKQSNQNGTHLDWVVFQRELDKNREEKKKKKKWAVTTKKKFHHWKQHEEVCFWGSIDTGLLWTTVSVDVKFFKGNDERTESFSMYPSSPADGNFRLRFFLFQQDPQNMILRRIDTFSSLFAMNLKLCFSPVLASGILWFWQGLKGLPSPSNSL